MFTISEPYKTNVPEGFEAIPILIHDAKPFIDAHIFTMESKWQKLRLILDLGANHKILLQNNSNTSKKTISNQKNAKGLGGSIFGIKTHAKSNRLGSIYYYNLAILIPTNNSYHRESMDIEKHASLGGRLFKKSIIVLDYINGN